MTLPYQLHNKQLRQAQQIGTRSSSDLSILKGLPFWIWDKEEHRQQGAQLMDIAALTTPAVFRLRTGRNTDYLIMKRFFMIICLPIVSAGNNWWRF